MFLVVCLILMSNKVAKGQMVGTDAYMKGQFMEFGINGLGGFEGVNVATSPILPGMHLRSANNIFGIVGNPQKNGWLGSAFDGDFFTPGSPENGWGIEIGTTGSVAAGTLFGNNCAYLQELNGAITSFATIGSYHTAIWEGNTTSGDLSFKINYTMHDTALFFATTVSITNNTLLTIPDLYYYKNFDPDNNQEILGTFTTTNTIVSQPDSVNSIAHVSAAQNTPWDSYIALIGFGSNWKATYGGFSNRDASDIWNGVTFTQTVGATNTADEAISLAYRIQNLAPGATETFYFHTVLDTSSIGAALIGDLFLDFVGENNNSSLIPDTITVCGTDSVQITVSGLSANSFNWEWSPSSGLSDSTGLSVMAYPSTQTTYTVIGTPISGGASPDTMLIVVETFPLFSLVSNLSSLGMVCSNASPFVITSGTTSGGIYSGVGIVNDSVFNPTSLNGSYIITYTLSDSIGCSSSDTAIIIVNGISVTLPSLGIYCNDSLFNFILSTGSPSGGIYSGPGVVNDTIFDFSTLPSTVGIFSITYIYTDSLGCTDSASNTIEISDCTGIDNYYLNNSVLVYPNPFSDFSIIKIDNGIQLQNTEMHVYDILGKEVVRLTEIHEHEFKFERKNLESGMYFYRLENNKKTIATGKLLIN